MVLNFWPSGYRWVLDDVAEAARVQPKQLHTGRDEIRIGGREHECSTCLSLNDRRDDGNAYAMCQYGLLKCSLGS